VGLSAREIEELAGRLATARERRAPVAALTAAHPALTVEDGYRIQRAQIEGRARAGDRVAGWKVGATTAAGRTQLGMDAPICGPIFASTVLPGGAAVETGGLIAPAAEAEIAFVMRARLAGPGVTVASAALAVEAAFAALEIVDSRYQDWRFTGPDAVADCSLSAALVVGPRLLPLRDLDLPLEGVVWELDGEVQGTATGAEVGGTPLWSVAWLANALAGRGLALEAGDVVSAGSLSKLLRPRAGQSVRATFTRLGAVAARFV
jgi:2-keto-4-pentenoate hydratase